MTAPPGDEGQRRVPPYVALVRIIAVIAMSAAAAFGLFLMLLGTTTYILVGLGIAALAIPPFLVMRWLERVAGPGPDEANERPG